MSLSAALARCHRNGASRLRIGRRINSSATARATSCSRWATASSRPLACFGPATFEVHAYSQLLHDYLAAGSRWLSAPRPRLLDELYDDKADFDKRLRNLEVAFDAANCLRAGKDIFYLVSDSGNEWGRLWLQTILGDEYRVHACPNLNCSIHIDSTITLLRPGLALVNPERVDDSNMPEPLKQWEILWAPPMEEYVYSDCRPVSSAWLGMNLLMVRPIWRWSTSTSMSSSGCSRLARSTSFRCCCATGGPLGAACIA